ncbi:hypothetical protein [Streptomyces sp. B3I8]|uniref:hypothetical protein n=1 Tax=Streptomyces sp. B3I8 TaxID=3042303 RepID=UPI0027D795C9|nr:hypothetical protein [Streptomyces sp. B3I8]
MTAPHTWDDPPDLTERAELVVAELASNAVLHGLVPGRCLRRSRSHSTGPPADSASRSPTPAATSAPSPAPRPPHPTRSPPPAAA